MKKMLLGMFALVVVLAAQAQSNAKLIDLKVTDVTVFLSGAQVTQSGTVQLKEGENVFRVTDLTSQLDPNSLQLEGNSNYTIMSVRHQMNYVTDYAGNPRHRALQDSLDDAILKRQEYQALKNVVQQERELMVSNRDIKAQNSTLLAEDLKEMADFYRVRFKELEYRWLELAGDERNNEKEISRLQNLLNQLGARKGTNPSEVLITLRSSKAGSANIKLSYLVYAAGWYPVYDLRSEDINAQIDFVYRAKVFQNTGSDWNDVNLTISTGNPTVGGQAPQIYPWYINIYEPRQDQVRTRYEAAPAPAKAGYAEEAIMLKAEADYNYDDKAFASSFTTVQSNVVNTEFKISIPYDIPSDNQQYDVVMQEQKLKATYAYIAVPKLDNDAFLRAQVTDWAQYSLLPGESNIYFKGTYVGKGFIDPALANDTLNLSMGRDRGISIKRDQIKDYCKTGVFGGSQRTTKAYEITVQNNKKQSIELVLEDQVPISQNGDLTVEVEEMSGATYDATTGKLTWKLTLAPGETVKKQIRFSAKYPKKKYISGL